MLTEAISMGTFKVDVVTTDNGGHPPEFWANQAVQKIMHVADSAPQPIRDQAKAFRDTMEYVILHAVKQAIESDRTTQAANLIKRNM